MVEASINLVNILEISETKQRVGNLLFFLILDFVKTLPLLKSILRGSQIGLETTLRFFWFDNRLKPTQSALQAFQFC
jgi:hypothetical protein